MRVFFIKYGLHISKDGKWSRVYTDSKGSRKLRDAEDVSSQISHHIFSMQDLINKEMIERELGSLNDFIDVEGIITLTNNVVEIENYSDIPIMRISGLYNHIRKHDKVLTMDQVNQIVQILKDNMMEPIPFPIIDYKKEYEQFKAYYAPIEDVAKNLQELVGYTDEVKGIGQ